MNDVLKGTFRVEIEAGTAIGREWISIRPKDIQVVTTLVNTETNEETQMVFCYGNSYPYTIRMSYAELVKLANEVEE
jgi:hypothetical protein